MILSDKIRFAGDVSIENISVVTSKGNTQNITNQVIKIEIYEDLFSPFTTGLVTVKDSFDFVNALPFIGEEFLNIKMFTPGIEAEYQIDQQYYIYKVSNRTITGDRTVVYQLHIVSKEAIVDANKKVSKAHQGLISDIVKDLFTNKEYGLETRKNVFVEPTANTTKFISNYWSPIKSLNYATGNAVSKTGAANYTFYENRKGFNFTSLDYLYSKDYYQEFLYDNYTRDVEVDRTTINLDREYKRILEIDIPVLHDYIQRAQSGMFSSAMATNDIFTKKYTFKTYDMHQDFGNTTHLNEYPPATPSIVKSPSAMVINMPREYGVFNGYTDVSNARSIQRRLSQLVSAQNTKINITVPGRTDYTVGQKVKVILNKIEPIGAKDSNDDILDKVLSGYYIVSAINHSVDREKHECIMELIKDTYIVDFNRISK